MRGWLREIRRAKRLSEKEVAEAVKISQPSYHRIETGQQNPTVDTAKRIADFLGFYWGRFWEERSA